LKSLGICIGASNLKAAVVSDNGDILKSTSISHDSCPQQAFSNTIMELGTSDIDYGYITGRKFRRKINLPSITEAESIESALRLLRSTGKMEESLGAVISLGAENFVLYLLDTDQNICAVETGNKCASGTGEFFLQQIRRMNLSVDEAVNLARESVSYRVSGRCSVFCKSDCTHALNKGIPAQRVTAGLCEMIAEKILDLLEKSSSKSILAIGGLTQVDPIMKIIRGNGYSLHIPECALIFEAVGAAWCALEEKRSFFSHVDYISSHRSFSVHPPLSTAVPKVTFKSIERSSAKSGDELVIGLDVGSTTTKAVALRLSDNAIVASTYLRTNGNPIEASRECYKELHSQLPGNVLVTGLGTTGSGRHIAGLHAGTHFIINEIIAHATAASYFDPLVDTIFEIGGQDAKYTHFTNGVPSDYAMNEACSAGTGSFLEEAAKESLGIDYREIQDYALESQSPPDFSDQCAAFISSDIKTASHEGVSREDITAGLVYSICMNYVNRVKGQRPIGKKVFMQGGVCYNKAVPLAMANLIGVPIVVPPEPGLMGAFGVALEVSRRMENETEKKYFNLQVLSTREISYGKRFICKGGREKCDRKCEISMLRIEDRNYPFGGACNRYYNLIDKKITDSGRYDFVRVRRNVVFSPSQTRSSAAGTIGLNNSFLMHSLFPLYSTFFSELGLEVILPDKVDSKGVKRKRGSFCYPGEISHGAFYNLLEKKPDFLFLPSIVELPAENTASAQREHQCTCMLLQGEPYYLRSAFGEVEPKLIRAVLDFSKGFDSQIREFIEIGRQCGFSDSYSRAAYIKAVEKMRQTTITLREEGERILSELEKSPDNLGVVLFGRAYNSFTSDANMGIPEKFASRGIPVIPWDMLPFENEKTGLDINWAIGRDLMKSATLVSRKDNLFGVYITNFSCGPDSFLLGYFREIMGEKPSLTLEVDSHTADAGINTRIDAFIDIAERYRSLAGKRHTSPEEFTPAKLQFKRKGAVFISSKGKSFSIYDPSVHLLLPSMGRLTSELMAAVFSGAGIRSTAVPVYNQSTLKTGRANTSCKECLPLILTTGGLLNHLQSRSPDEKILYFMPTCWGNCRFTQYRVFLNRMISRRKIPDVALISLSNENGYAGLRLSDSMNLLKSIIISDCMDDIRNALRVLAIDLPSAQKTFQEQWERIIQVFLSRRYKDLYNVLRSVADNLLKIPLRYPLSQARTVSLMGEIFVRRDDFSSNELIEKLSAADIVVKRAPILEWISYCDFNVKKGIYEARFDLKKFLEFRIRNMVQDKYEKRIKSIFARSGLYSFEKMDLDTAIAYGEHFFDVRFTGESILVAGNFFKDILHTIHGAVSIGPFSCMPTRITEAVMAPVANNEIRSRLTGDFSVKNVSTLPFLSVEIDGSPLSQTLEARIEAFCLQVERIYHKVRKSGAP